MKLLIRPAAEAGGQRERAQGDHLHLHGSAHAHLPVAPCPPQTPAERQTPHHGKHAALIYSVIPVDVVLMMVSVFRKGQRET